MRKWDELTQQQRVDYRENRREYIGRRCTLNGHPATVVFDSATGFASVASGPTTIAWSWSAVFNIIDNKGGRFECEEIPRHAESVGRTG